MSDKPSYLGLLNAISVAETDAFHYLNAWIETTPNPDVKLTAYDVDDMNVRLYDRIAVVTGRVTTKRLVKGQATTSQSRFTDVFVSRDGRWQLVAGHSSRIRTPS